MTEKTQLNNQLLFCGYFKVSTFVGFQPFLSFQVMVT